jgi:dTDP-L-rhamnose 4-epimerase
VCSGRPRTILDLARGLHRVLAPDGPGAIVTGEHRLGDVRHVFADATRAATTLGFKAQEDFDAGLAELGRELVAA